MDPTIAALIGFALGSVCTHAVYLVVLLWDERSRNHTNGSGA